MSIITDSVTAHFSDHTQMGYRGRVFGQRITTEDVAVDPTDGTVRAWDDVAGYWTTCHSITDRGIRSIRRAAGL
jgi:hypothetical protein